MTVVLLSLCATKLYLTFTKRTSTLRGRMPKPRSEEITRKQQGSREGGRAENVFLFARFVVLGSWCERWRRTYSHDATCPTVKSNQRPPSATQSGTMAPCSDTNEHAIKHKLELDKGTQHIKANTAFSRVQSRSAQITLKSARTLNHWSLARKRAELLQLVR